MKSSLANSGGGAASECVLGLFAEVIRGLLGARSADGGSGGGDAAALFEASGLGLLAECSVRLEFAVGVAARLALEEGNGVAIDEAESGVALLCAFDDSVAADAGDERGLAAGVANGN